MHSQFIGSPNHTEVRKASRNCKNGRNFSRDNFVNKNSIFKEFIKTGFCILFALFVTDVYIKYQLDCSAGVSTGNLPVIYTFFYTKNSYKKMNFKNPKTFRKC